MQGNLYIYSQYLHNIWSHWEDQEDQEEDVQHEENHASNGQPSNILLGCLCPYAVTTSSKSNCMSLWTYRRSSAFKRPSDIVLRWSDLTNPRAELARSTDAVVTGVTSSSFRTCRTFGNKSSCSETLVFFFFFPFFFFFFFFFWPARGGGASPRPPWIRYWSCWLSVNSLWTILFQHLQRIVLLLNERTASCYTVYSCWLQNIMWFPRFLAAWLASGMWGSIAVSQGLSRLSSSSSGFLLWSGEAPFKVGDSVLVHREILITPEAWDRPSDKRRPKWHGPFKIIEEVQICPNAFRLDLPFPMKSHLVFNVSALKKYNLNCLEGRTVDPPPPVTDLDGFERSEVECVLSHRRRRHKLEYLVKWVAYLEATWRQRSFSRMKLVKI